MSKMTSSLVSHSGGNDWNAGIAGPVFLQVKLLSPDDLCSRVADFSHERSGVPKAKVEAAGSS